MKVFWMAPALLLAACGAKEQTTEQKEAAVSAAASIAGSMLVSAARKCNIIGVSKIDECVNVKGKLLEEISAQTSAQLAVQFRTSFWQDCQKNFHADYCTQLLTRAAEIAWRKPPATD